MEVQMWRIERLIFYVRKPRNNEEVPVIVSNTWSAAQVKAFGDLSLTGFKPHETNALLGIRRQGRDRIGTYALLSEVCDAAA
jgi:hypothetical protein